MAKFSNTERLADLIHRKHEVLSQLRELARKQLEQIDQGDMTRLLNVLSAKQNLLSQIQQIEQALHPFRDEIPEQRVWRSSEHRQHTAQLSGRCSDLLREIMLMEKQSEPDLIERRDATAGRLRVTANAAEARQAYVQATGMQSRDLDVTSE